MHWRPFFVPAVAGVARLQMSQDPAHEFWRIQLRPPRFFEKFAFA